jgi:transcriptional regulator with XRE-family HTH domain
MPKRRKGQGYPDLATFIAETGTTQAYIARRVGTTQAHISRIASGEAVPRTLLAARLAAFAGIPLDSFTKVYLSKHNGSRVA